MPIERISTFGERNSGTNYLIHLLAHNIENVQIALWKFGWKHMVPYDNSLQHCTDQDLIIVVFKNILSLLVSIYNRPHEIPYRCRRENCLLCDLCQHDDKLSFNEFIRHEYYSIRAKSSSYLLGAKVNEELSFERDVTTGERYPNIVAMLNDKYKGWLSLGNKVRNVYFVDYIQLITRTEEILKDLSSKYDLQLKDEFVNIANHTKDQSRIFDKSYYLEKKYMEYYSDDILNFVKSNIDEDMSEFL